MDTEQPAVVAHRPVKLIVASVLIVIVLLAAAAWFLPSISLPLRMAWSAYTLPEELRGAHFLSEGEQGTRVHRANTLSFSTSESDVVVVSESRSSRGEVRIVAHADGRYRVLIDGRELPLSATPKAGISRSPNGAMIAYAERREGAVEELPAASILTVTPLDLTQWDVKTYHPESGASITLGTGASPVFVGDRYILRVAPLGMYLYDLRTGVDTQMVARATKSISLGVLASPDSSLIGLRDVGARSIVIYRVAETQVTEVGTIQLPAKVTSLALGNEAVYVLRTGSWGTEIHAYAIDGSSSRLAAILPESLRVSRLLLTAI